ncbi:MAG: helix-turn-helix domain-containing protein [Deltaproteobacteria bacterium]|jgi:hypothetical protein|nr:helix-turn-helix domain-containing protein [Deltaproteobacteria bacterium]
MKCNKNNINSPINENPPVNEKFAAAFNGVAVQTMRNWRHQGRGPAYLKLGSRVVYLLEDLKRFREESRINPEK